MSERQFDLFVIGAGSGGVRAARMAAQRGARVALAESAALGGTCVNLGCIPKKLYSYAARYAEAFEEARGYGWPVQAPALDWALLKANRAQEIRRLNGIYDNLLEGAGVTVVRGRARLTAPHEVTVGELAYRAERVLVATGGRPTVPELPGSDLAVISDQMFDLPEFPRRLAVVGGGYIACEFASIFCGLGAQVTQFVRRPQVLRGFDDDVREVLSREMVKKGVQLRTGTQLRSIERTGQGLRLSLDDGSAVVADVVLLATGRAANTEGLGLQALGVALREGGGIAVDARYRTNLPWLFALGDVTDRVQLTPVAIAEAMVLVDQLYGASERTLDYELIPTAVFTHPNVGTVGLTEAQARERLGDVRIYRSEFRALVHTVSGSSERTFVKLVVDAASDRVVGLHMVGPEAGEIVQGFAVAMKAGATKAQFDATIGIHPTLAEEFVTLREPAAATTFASA